MEEITVFFLAANATEYFTSLVSLLVCYLHFFDIWSLNFGVYLRIFFQELVIFEMWPGGHLCKILHRVDYLVNCIEQMHPPTVLVPRTNLQDTIS